MQHMMQHATESDWSQFIFNLGRTTWNGFQPLSSARVSSMCPQTATILQHPAVQPSQDEILLHEVQVALDETRALMRSQFGPTVEAILSVLEEIDKFSSDFARNDLSTCEVLEVADVKC